MGCYLACGLALRFDVMRGKNNKKDLKDLARIKKQLNKFFNIKDYDVDTKTYSNAFIFTIKEDVIEKNIHETIKEVYNLYKYSIFYYPSENDYEDEGVKLDENFNQENYPLKLKIVKNGSEDEPKIFGKDGCTLNDTDQFGDPYWLYASSSIYEDNKRLFDSDGKYRVYITPAIIWSDIPKYCGEDETSLLLALNTMKNKYFKNELSKDLHFYIAG